MTALWIFSTSFDKQQGLCPASPDDRSHSRQQRTCVTILRSQVFKRRKAIYTVAAYAIQPRMLTKTGS